MRVGGIFPRVCVCVKGRPSAIMWDECTARSADPHSCCLFVFSGKYGRHTSLPFLRPPLTTALLTLGKAQQVSPPASACALISIDLRGLFCCCCFVSVFFTVMCACLAERHARERAGPPEPPAHAARTTATPAHQRQTHQQRKTQKSGISCVFSAQKIQCVLQAELSSSKTESRFHKQLLPFCSTCSTSSSSSSLQVSSLLGDPSRLLVQKALSLRPPGLLQLGKGLLGDSPSGERSHE